MLRDCLSQQVEEGPVLAKTILAARRAHLPGPRTLCGYGDARKGRDDAEALRASPPRPGWALRASLLTGPGWGEGDGQLSWPSIQTTSRGRSLGEKRPTGLKAAGAWSGEVGCPHVGPDNPIQEEGGGLGREAHLSPTPAIVASEHRKDGDH